MVFQELEAVLEYFGADVGQVMNSSGFLIFQNKQIIGVAELDEDDVLYVILTRASHLLRFSLGYNG